jgi:hypothetical protein
MMRRTGQQVKSLPVIYVFGALLGLNMTRATRLSQSRRFLTIVMIVKRHAIRCRR